jgi:hypothetical protein
LISSDSFTDIDDEAQLLQTIHQTLAVKNKSFGRKSITR